MTRTAYIGYVRVSTQKQGEQGASLDAQREAILGYAARHSIEIGSWMEERETAARRGRPVFGALMKLLRAGRAAGVVVHKIDRSARNLADWADLGQLIDAGIDVRFATEDLDLRSRGGRLAADIQAVVAADYVRNLRDEALKGMKERLRQGIYPFRAPIGYLNTGAGKPKTIDPLRGPLVRHAFELYDRGDHGLVELRDELDRLGLLSQAGGRVSLSTVAAMMRNPFYSGMISVRQWGETFRGAHEPLISVALFQRVQERIDGRANRKAKGNAALFARMIRCQCGAKLIGERQKGRVYYRCHTGTCAFTTVREDRIEAVIETALKSLVPSHEDLLELRLHRAEAESGAREREEKRSSALRARLRGVEERDARLTDALVDGLLERSAYLKRKESLVAERIRIEEDLKTGGQHGEEPAPTLDYLELAEAAWNLYRIGNEEERRAIVEICTSNWSVRGRNLELTLVPPLRELSESRRLRCGGPTSGSPRTTMPQAWTHGEDDKMRSKRHRSMLIVRRLLEFRRAA